jgi:hypothetical protein
LTTTEQTKIVAKLQILSIAYRYSNAVNPRKRVGRKPYSLEESWEILIDLAEQQHNADDLVMAKQIANRRETRFREIISKENLCQITDIFSRVFEFYKKEKSVG